MTVFHRQDMLYVNEVNVHICYLCQCQEKFKARMTYTYVKMMKSD